LIIKVAIGDHDGSIRIFNENKSLTHQFKAHDKVVRRLKFNPFTSLLASCSSDSYVKIWHTNNYTEPLYTFKHDGEVYTMDFIDNNTIATGSLDKTVKIWNLSSGNLTNKINVEYSVSCIKMLPNGLLAVASESNLIRIFNYTNGNLTKTLNGHKNIVNNLELIVSNKFVYLASAGIDTTILIWDLNDNYKCIRNMTYSSDESYSHYLKFIEHSNLLVSSSSNKTVNIWEMPSGKLIKTIDDFTWHVLRSIDFVPDNSTNNSEDRGGGGGTLLIGGLDGKVIFWNVSSGIITRTYNMSFGFGIFSLAALDTTRKKTKFKSRERWSKILVNNFGQEFKARVALNNL
jgi:WD40 repeat protein